MTRLAVLSVWAEDVSVCTHFYRDVIGLPMRAQHHGGRPHFDLDGTFLTILRGKPRPAQDMVPERFPLFALTVEDLDATVLSLHEHGVAMPWDIEQDESARWVMFHDPAGNLIELVQFGP